MLRMKILFPILLVVPTLSMAQADDSVRSHKKSWQWPDSERIAARLDPAYVVKHAKPADAGKVTFSINGRDNPHLFLPYELFNWLMGGLGGDSAFRNTTRAMLYENIKSFGYTDPDAFWSELDAAVRSHVDLLHRASVLQQSVQTTGRPQRDAVMREIENLQIPLCRSRADALNAARAHFGRETFDRFLYTVVAPQLSVNSPMPSSEEARGLAYVEGGCR